jgi:hypothetical protein
MSRYASGLVVALLLAGSGALHAQGGRLVASVVEAGTGAPIEGAEVVLPELRCSAWADANGEATLGALPAGDHRVRVRHLGHVSAELTVRVGGKPVGAMFILERRVVNFDTVRVSARYVPFDAPLAFRQRQDLGIGRFLTDRDLRPEGDREFATVMSTRIAGVRAKQRGANRCLELNRKKPIFYQSPNAPRFLAVEVQGSCYNAECPVRVLLDDIDVTDELWLVKTWDLAAVEYYTETTAPAQYRTGKKMCGIILLWSKK